MRKSLFLENAVGILSGIAVVFVLLVGAFFVTQNNEHSQAKTNPTPAKQQTVKAESIDAKEIDNLYQQIQDKKAEEKRQIEEAKQKAEDDKRRAEEEKRKAEEARLKAEAEKQKAEEARKQAEIEKQQIAEERKKAEKERQQAEAVRKKADAEKKRLAEEAKKQAEAEKKRKAEEARKQAEAEKKRQAEEAKKKAEAEKKRKAEEARKKAEAEKKRQAEEAKKKAEEARKAKEAAEQQAILDSLQGDIEDRAKADAISRYAAAIEAKVQDRWTLPPNLPSGLKTKLTITTNSNGLVKDVRISQSSGNSAFDNSALEAVKRASPLPLPDKVEWAKEFAVFDFWFEPGG